MDFTLDQDTYNKYLKKEDYIINERIRLDDENFFDALMSIDMENEPAGKKVIEFIKAL